MSNTDNTAHAAPDVLIYVNGSMVGIQPMTPAADQWIAYNLPTELWQWLGNTLWIDHRCAPAIIEGMQHDGLEVPL